MANPYLGAGGVSFMAPVYSLKLEGRAGSQIDLRAWSKRYATNENQYPFATQFEIELMLGHAGTLSATLTPPIEVFRKMVNENVDAFQQAAIMEIILGYGERQTAAYRGVLDWPDVSMQDDYVEVSLEATSSLWMASRTNSNMTDTVKGVLGDDFEVPVYRYLQAFAKAHEVNLYYLSPGDGEKELQGPVNPVLGNLSSQKVSYKSRMNDWMQLKRLIQYELEFQFYTRDNRLVIVDPVAMAKNKQTPKFIYGGKVKPDEGYYPIINFETDGTDVALRKAFQKTVCKDFDDASKEEATLSATAQKQASGPDEKQANVVHHRNQAVRDEIFPSMYTTAPDKVQGQGKAKKGNVCPVPSSDPAGESKVKREKQQGEMQAAIKCEWETMGFPWEPGNMLRVGGVTDLYNGLYQAQRVSHSGSMDGYMTTLKGMAIGRNGEPVGVQGEAEGETSVDEGEPATSASGDKTTKTAEPAGG